MKSKIQKNQILIKGVTIFILVIMILSCLAVVKPNLVMAEEDTEDTEDVDDPNFTVISSEDSDLDFIEVDSESNSISADLKYLKEQIKKMASYSDIEYNAFMDELKNNKIVTVDNELKLRALSIYVAEGNDCRGKTINMTKNIELTSTEEWEPIGSSERPFKGTFNGYGHTISGMLITKQNNNVGLFGYVYKGIIKNIKISKNCTINIPLEIENDINDIVSPAVAKYAYLGAVVGYAKNTSIYNCTNAADVFGGSSVGGIVGCLYNETYIDEEGKEKNEKIRIQDCINTGSVKGLASIGGIVGRVYGTCPYTKDKDGKVLEDKDGNAIYNYSLVQRCRNTGTIFGVSTNIGGIAGTIKGNSRVYKSENEGQVSTNIKQKDLKINGKTETISPQNVGGIVGSTGGTDKTNGEDISTRIWLSINKGKVFGYSEIGGIVGHLGNSTGGYSVAIDCINYTNDIEAYRKKEGSTTVYAGKIAGWVGYGEDYQKGRVYNCYYQITSDDKDKGTKSHWALNTKIWSDNELVRAIGGYTGPTSGTNFKGNNSSWKIKESEGNYYFQGRMYKVNSGNLETDGYTVYYKTAKSKNTWFSRKNNTDPSTNGKDAGEITINSDKEKPSPNYQPWLYRISNYLEFNGTECVIDNEEPYIINDKSQPVNTVKVSTASKFDIAVPGDKILFSVEFDENIRYDRDLVLKFKIGKQDRTATFLGVDNNVAEFEYIVEKNEGITESKPYTNEDYLVNNITLSKIVKDTFSKIKEFNNDSLKQEGSVIVMSGDQNSPNALYFSSKYEIDSSTSLNTVYKFYEGNYINEKDKLFYNKDNFAVKVNINKALTSGTSTQPINYTLHIELDDGENKQPIKVEIKRDKTDPDSLITNSSSTWIRFRGKNVSAAFEGKSFNNKKIKKMYVTTNEDVNVAVGDNKHISLQLNEGNTVIKETNINKEINRIYIDTKAPSFTAEYSTKEKYTIGDQINIKLTSSEELSSGKDLSLKVKFDESDGKGNVKLISGPTKNENDGNKTELIYQYIVQDGDNGKLSISTEGTIKDLALNETDLSKITDIKDSGKYADTTVPTVNITSDEAGPINADSITYTFDWSEEVTEFEAKDITIIGGKIKEGTDLVQNSTDKTKYTLEVTPSVVAGNEGQVQVIVEANVCKDAVGLGNLRTESTIKVDKKAPTLTSYNVKKSDDGNSLIVETIFDEAIGTARQSDIEVKFGENLANGTVKGVNINKNDNRIVTYTYNISGADEGTPTITLKANTVKDIAGNANSSAYTLENKDIVLEKHVIITDGYEYSFSKNEVAITNFENPTYFKAGDKITVTNSEKTYEYTIEAGKYDNNSYMKYMTLTGQTTGTASFSETSTADSIYISAANIYFDTTAPRLTTKVYAENGSETTRYSKGTKIIIETSIDEKINANDISYKIPEIQVNFSQSGAGKYNFTNGKEGYAKYEKEVVSQDGKITYYYNYVVENGDEGTLSIEYKNGNVTDLAGNSTDATSFNVTIPSTGDNNLSDSIIYDSTTNTTVSYEIYKNNSRVNDFNTNTYFKVGDKIKVKATINKKLYTSWQDQTIVDVDKAPKLDIKIGNNTLVSSLKPSLSFSGYKTILTYEYTVNNEDQGGKITGLELSKPNTYYAIDAEHQIGDISANTASAVTISKSSSNVTTNITNCNLFIDTVNLDGAITINPPIYVDTTVPTVNITAKKVVDDTTKTNVLNNITNADKVEYTFTWSEEVTGFTAEDVTVNNGNNVTFTPNPTDKKVYTMTVDTTVEAGNVGDIQVIVEKGACQDIVGHENVRTESVIRVDKQAPILIGLEAYATSNISVNENVDTVKEHYKVGDTVTIIATFSENIASLEENITGLPKLALQFSESGNAKGPVNPGTISGNKITYTYSITDEDNGTLSVKGFSGTVVDAAGNETRVTKRALDGDTIIADTKLPTLQALNVTSNKIENKATEKITIEAVYDEEVYALITKEDGTKEIVNITNENAPKLNLSFVKEDANGTSIEVEAKGEMTAQYAENDKTRIIYTYTVAGEEEAGDNGKLKINDLVNNANAQVCDIAGNTSENNTETKTTKDVLADTIRPQVTNITASIDESESLGFIENTKGDPLGETSYYKEKTVIEILVEYSEPIHEKLLDTIDIAFSENKLTTYKKASIINWNEDENTIRYKYTIENGDNGYLWVKVPEGIAKDEAGNLNFGADAEKLSNIYADTTAPTVTLLRDTTVEQNNQTITIKAQFSENVYDLNNNSRVTLTKTNAPKLIYSFGTGKNQEISASNIDGAIITYEINKNAVTDNGTLHYELAKGNLCDRAGNEYYQETTDTTAPILEEVVISSNAGMYEPYCKAGTEIYVTATFDEAIAAKNIKLIATIGNVETAEINGEAVAENSKQIRFTYTVKAGDTGKFEIKDICGEIDNQITGENADNTYGWVRDEKGNQNNIYSLADEGITPTGKAEADTKAPYITSIKAKANDKEIATYTKEEGKDAVITVGRTNANIIEYIVTYSENIPYNHFDRIRVINGIIKDKDDIQYTSNNEYKITVQTTVEGVQSLIIPEGTAEDKAGNTDGFVRLDAVTVDFTKPTVRFISEYNGGIYVLPTNIGKVEIRPNVEISEDIATIEYKWDDGEYKPIENYSSSSDIAIPTKAFTEAGEYVLSIRVKDLAGNIAETSKTYTVINSNINIELSTSEYTNQDITATVSFGNGLTDNRKVAFKTEGSNELIELNAKGTNENGTEYTIETNGTIYVEATDKVGNKVFTEKVVNNIDKVAPEVELSINGGNLVIGTGKDKATVKTTVKTNEPTTIKYAWEGYGDGVSWGFDWQNSINNIDELELVTTPELGTNTCYLNIIAIDIAGNETQIKSLAFNIKDSNSRVSQDGSSSTLVEAENTIQFERHGQYVDVIFGSNLSENRNIELTKEEDGYVYDNYVEVLKPTTVTATASDVCGNTVIATYVVESVEGPKFEIIGNPKDWTNQDVKLEVSTYDALKALTVNGEDILSKEENIRSNIVVSENGDYEFIATDTYGNISKKTVKVEKIDKVLPVISKVENEGKDITITATDELSGVAEYAITSTTEIPVEWSKSNVIKTTKDGTFYVWAKDNAGNVTMKAEAIIVDTTAPTIAFNYSLSTVIVGTPIETTITTNEDAKISYSWDNETWVDSEEFITSLKVSKETRTNGSYTLYAKAADKSGNTSKVQTIKFTVIENPDNIKVPEIIFEDLPTIQVNGVKYVKVSADMTSENVTNKMDKNALCEATPEYTKLTSDNKLRTGSEITISDETKYIIVVNGDTNCDGKVSPIDVTTANSIRLNKVKANIIQQLAADFDLDGVIKPIDITMINSYRLGKIKGI